MNSSLPASAGCPAHLCSVFCCTVACCPTLLQPQVPYCSALLLIGYYHCGIMTICNYLFINRISYIVTYIILIFSYIHEISRNSQLWSLLDIQPISYVRTATIFCFFYNYAALKLALCFQTTHFQIIYVINQFNYYKDSNAWNNWYNMKCICQLLTHNK